MITHLSMDAGGNVHIQLAGIGASAASRFARCRMDVLIDRIYEAVVYPASWSVALDRLASLAGGEGAFLSLLTDDSAQWIASHSWMSKAQQLVTAGDLDIRHRRLPLKARNQFLREVELFDNGEVERQRRLLRPLGLGSYIAASGTAGSNGIFTVSVERQSTRRSFSARSVATLNRIYPHLTRAIHLHVRSTTDSNRRTLDFYQEGLSLAAAIVTRDRTIVASNRQFDALRPAISIARDGRLIVSNDAAEEQLAKALLRFGWAGPATSPISIAIPHAGKTTPHLIGALRPLPTQTMCFGRVPIVLLVVRPVIATQAISLQLIREVFGLTQTEARVAHGLAQGCAVREIARLHDVEPNTIRVQLKSVYEKTGTHRQAELVRLLSSCASF